MKLPNWLMLIWWGLAMVGMLLFLLARLPELEAGRSTLADIVVFLVLVCLWVLPLATEIDILGIRLKREVHAVKEELKGEIRELRNSVEVRNTFSPNVYMPAPPPDQKLPEIKEQIHAAVKEAMGSVQFGRPTVRSGDFKTTADAEYLFGVRYNLEKEVRRIYSARYEDTQQRFTSVISMSKMLVRSEDLSPQLSDAIRKVYAACSAAVHGEDVSEAQVSFVKDVAPELLGALKAIA